MKSLCLLSLVLIISLASAQYNNAQIRPQISPPVQNPENSLQVEPGVIVYDRNQNNKLPSTNPFGNNLAVEPGAVIYDRNQNNKLPTTNSFGNNLAVEPGAVIYDRNQNNKLPTTNSFGNNLAVEPGEVIYDRNQNNKLPTTNSFGNNLAVEPGAVIYDRNQNKVPSSSGNNLAVEPGVVIYDRNAQTQDKNNKKIIEPLKSTSNNVEELRYLGSSGTNWGYSGSNGGTLICTICSTSNAQYFSNAQKCCAYGFSQCCNAGLYTTHARPNYHNNLQPIGGGWHDNNQWTTNNRDKPGSCGVQNMIWNQNSGYYYTRRRRDAEKSESYNYQSYSQPQFGNSNSGGYGYPDSSGYNINYNSGYNNNQHSGGYSGYSHGSYNPSPIYTTGGFHGGNGIIPTTQRPNYCRRDYDCPGIKKCCGGYCTNPTAVIG